MKILAIDPHITKPYAYAFYIDTLLWQLGSGDLKKMSELIKIADHVFVEDQYFGGNKSTLRQLAQSSGKLLGICEDNRVPYSLVHPSTWQSKAKIRFKKPKGISQYQWKKDKGVLLMLEAEKIIGQEGVVKNDDVAVAIIMGYVMGVQYE